ncbi:unnamed protein product [Amoebophrya sp. A25]|nr:unnamed protein product [Amoebophrya sp. A25]|eukprot:GSA25T00026621001.1
MKNKIDITKQGNQIYQRRKDSFCNDIENRYSCRSSLTHRKMTASSGALRAKILALFLFGQGTRQAEGCTALAVSRGATEGKDRTFVSHNDDDTSDDVRAAYVPASEKLARRKPIYAAHSTFPRYVGDDRGETYQGYMIHTEEQHVEEDDDYFRDGSEAASKDVYYPARNAKNERKRIRKFLDKNVEKVKHRDPVKVLDWEDLFEKHPELREFKVSKTFGYYEEFYPLLNDAGLTMGESTCTAMILHNKSPGLLQIADLMQLAMERCGTARCAIKLMGRLSELYGFAPEETGMDGSSEAVTVGDGKEAWVFHILPDGEEGSVWVAQRVPDGHVAPVANHFVIHHVDCDDSANFLCGENLFSTAKKRNLWDGKTTFDFERIYSPDPRLYLPRGSIAIPYYNTQRVFRVYELLAPSLKFPLTNDTRTYPFSVPVDRGVTRENMMAIHADRFEGSAYDQSAGMLAGPFGNPNILEGGTGLLMTGSQVPRAISIPRTIYGQVGESFADKNYRSILWLALDQPASSVYVPILQGTKKLSKAFMVGTRYELDRRSTWWAFNLVGNQMQLYYNRMDREVSHRRRLWQKKLSVELAHLCGSETLHCPLGDSDLSERLTLWQKRSQTQLAEDWFRLSDELTVKYLDGTENTMERLGKPFGYPAYWLQMAGENVEPTVKWAPVQAQPTLQPPEFFVKYGAANPDMLGAPLNDTFIGAALDASAVGTRVVLQTPQPHGLDASLVDYKDLPPESPHLPPNAAAAVVAGVHKTASTMTGEDATTSSSSQHKDDDANRKDITLLSHTAPTTSSVTKKQSKKATSGELLSSSSQLDEPTTRHQADKNLKNMQISNKAGPAAASALLLEETPSSTINTGVSHETIICIQSALLMLLTALLIVSIVTRPQPRSSFESAVELPYSRL